MGGGEKRETEANAADLAWLEGRWLSESAEGVFEETWSSVQAGTMVGMGRLIRGETTVFMEFMSIEPNDEGGLTLWMVLGAPSRGEKKPKPFRLVETSPDSATFEMADNGFPKTITYTRLSEDRVDCHLRGGPDDETRLETYVFHRGR